MQAMTEQTFTETMETISRGIATLVGARIPMHLSVIAFKKRYIRESLKANGGRKSPAAKQIGVHRNTLQRNSPETSTPCPARARVHLTKQGRAKRARRG